MVIRVSGYPGSGKTTLCNRLAEALGYKYRNGGEFFRAMAAEKGLSIEEFYISLSENPDLEMSVDNQAAELMRTTDNLVMEGRVVPFLPCSFKTVNVLLTVDPKEGARRNLQRPENAGRTVEDMERQTAERLAAERKHYKTLYNIADHFAPEHYNIVVDTTTMTPDQVFEKVMGAIQHPPTP